MEIKSMLSRRKKKKVIKEMTARFFLILFSLIFIFPFFWMVSTSLKPDYQIFQFPPVWIPDPVQWSNYPEALTYFPFFQQLRNTMYMVGMSVLGTLFACPLVAYSFSRYSLARERCLIYYPSDYYDATFPGKNDSSVHPIYKDWLGGNL